MRLTIFWRLRLFMFICKEFRKVGKNKKFGDPSLEKHFECISCGLSHKKVEAGGIWGCPNIACTVSGNAWFRSQLKSFKDEDNDKHSVDPEEWEAKVRELLPTITDPDIYAATEHSLFKMRGTILSTK